MCRENIEEEQQMNEITDGETATHTFVEHNAGGQARIVTDELDNYAAAYCAEGGDLEILKGALDATR